MTLPSTPSTQSRNERLAETFVQLADVLVDDFDVVDLLDRLVVAVVELCSVSAAGILLDDGRGQLALVASSSEQTRLLELFQLQSDQGPCLDCFATRAVVACSDLRDDPSRWPVFSPAAVASGFRCVLALPLRLREVTIGSLNIFDVRRGPLPVGDSSLAQAFADVATIGILQHRSAHRSQRLAEQLQYALNSRVLIEQAKGVLAESLGLSVEESFVVLRHYSRDRNIKLTDVARALVEGRMPGAALR